MIAKAIDLQGLSTRINARLAALNLSERAAGNLIRSPDAIRNISRAAREGKIYNPRADTIAAIATVLQTTPAWLLTGEEEQDHFVVEATTKGGYRPPPRFMSETEKLPVFSSAEGGEGSLILSSEPIEFMPRPTALEGVKEAYAILFVGVSMFPAIKPGQIGWVDPRLPPMGGEEHVFHSSRPDLGEERAMVKELVSWTNDKWRVHQWKPDKTFDLARKDWQRCHRIMGKFNRR